MSRKFSKYFVAWLIKWKQEQNPNNFCNKYFVIIKDCIWLWKRTSWKNWKILRKDRTNSRFTSKPMEQGFYFDLKLISVIFSGPHERKICWIWRHNSYKIETKRIIDNNYNGTIIYDGMCFTWSIYHWLVLSLAGIQVFPHYSLLPNRLETIRPSSTTFGTPKRNPEEKTKFNCLLPEAYWYDVNRNGTIYEFHTTICYIISVGVYNLICQILERSSMNILELPV